MLADHGESLAEHGEYTHGIFLYDATLHIPFLIAGPGVPAGVRVKQQVRTIDVLPTILELMGGKPPAVCQGVNLAPAFAGKDVATTYSYAETLYPKMNMGWAELRGIRTARWKYIRAPKPELYDLAQDPGEKHNVIDSHPQEFRELESQLKKLSGSGAGDTEKVRDQPDGPALHGPVEVARLSLRIRAQGSGPERKGRRSEGPPLRAEGLRVRRRLRARTAFRSRAAWST